jgi:hypothetical protein
LWARSQAGANGSNIAQAFFRMGNKERLGIDIDQANGGSILLTIIVQVDGGVGQMPACDCEVASHS